MLELMLILGLVVAGGVALVAIAAFAVKVVFKLLLLPFTLAFFLLKAVAGLILIVLAVAVAPVLIVGLMLLAIPLLLVAGVVGFGALVTS